jgi:uncharacterized protein YndB with AHSA1/START domain
MSKVLRKEAWYAHPRESVWTAITDPRALAEWLMPNNFAAEVGRTFRFQVDPMGGFSGINECTVTEVDPPSRLSYTWRTLPKDPAGGLPPAMTLTWTLTEENGGTRLVLEQTNIESLNLWWRVSMSFGWNRMMRSLLPRVLKNVSGGGFTPGAVTRRDYKSLTVPEDFAK